MTNNNIIKFSLLKNHFKEPVKNFMDLNSQLLHHLELAKYNKYDFDNYIRLFSFYLIFSEFLSLSDLNEKDLTKEQREILLNCSSFLIKFWKDGLKFFVTYIHIEDHYINLWNYFYFISFWFEIPALLYVFKPILEVLDIPDVLNLLSSVIFVIDDFIEYLFADDSLFFLYDILIRSWKKIMKSIKSG